MPGLGAGVGDRRVGEQAGRAADARRGAVERSRSDRWCRARRRRRRRASATALPPGHDGRARDARRPPAERHGAHASGGVRRERQRRAARARRRRGEAHVDAQVVPGAIAPRQRSPLTRSRRDARRRRRSRRRSSERSPVLVSCTTPVAAVPGDGSPSASARVGRDRRRRRPQLGAGGCGCRRRVYAARRSATRPSRSAAADVLGQRPRSRLPADDHSPVCAL